MTDESTYNKALVRFHKFHANHRALHCGFARVCLISGSGIETARRRDEVEVRAGAAVNQNAQTSSSEAAIRHATHSHRGQYQCFIFESKASYIKVKLTAIPSTPEGIPPPDPGPFMIPLVRQLVIWTPQIAPAA